MSFFISFVPKPFANSEFSMETILNFSFTSLDKTQEEAPVSKINLPGTSFNLALNSIKPALFILKGILILLIVKVNISLSNSDISGMENELELNWTDFTINFDEFEDEDLLSPWGWLLEEDLKPVLITSFGDMFLMNEKDEVFWLSISEGLLDKIANSEKELKDIITNEEFFLEVFLPHLVLEMKDNDNHLEEGQVYGFIKSPLHEGEFEISNLEIKEYLDYSSECSNICKQPE